MTILQSRTIAIINAGLDYQQGLLALAKHIEQLCSEAEHHRDFAHTCNQIRLTCRDPNAFLNNATSSYHTLLTERDHFVRNYKRNKANADRIRKKRAESAAALGVTIKPRAPIPPSHAAYHIDPILIAEQDKIPVSQKPQIGVSIERAEEILNSKRKLIAEKLKYNPSLLDQLEADPTFEAPELGERWLINEAIHTMRFDPTKATSSPSPFDSDPIDEDLTP